MVTKVLRNECYTGMTTYSRRVRDKVGSTHTVKVEREDWIAVAGTHESIVTQEEFDRGQQALRDFIERGKCAEKDPRARKIRCGVCGHIMTHFNGKEKYYYCRTQLVQNNCACIEVHIPKKDLMAALLDGLHAQAAVAVDLNKL